MKFYRILLISITCAVAATALPQFVEAAGVTYSNRRKQVNAAVAVLREYDASGFPLLSDKINWYPYVFYVMDRRADMKPRGWEFINPLAPRQVYKNSQSYWRVNIEQVSLDNLTRLDVLYVCADSSMGSPLRFPMDIRDKLRQFVDAGGVLWIDNPGPAGAQGLIFDDNPANVFFISEPGSAMLGGAGHPWIYERHHPLATSPFWLMPQDAAYMGLDSEGAGRYFLQQTVPPAFPPIVILGNDTSKAYVGAIEYGSGKVVVTAGGIGGGIHPGDWRSLAVLPTELGELDIQRLSRPPSLKIAYNIINWASSYSGFRKNPRHSGYAPEGISTGHVEKWKLAQAPSGNTEAGVAILKDVFFYTGGGKLWALDGVPENDLDSDGNSDDGYEDDPGSTIDVLWSADVGDASAPVAFTAQVGNDTIECVMVQTVGGEVQVFRAFPSTGSKLDGKPERVGGFAMEGSSGKRIFAPTFFKNHIFASGGDGCTYGIEFPIMLSGGKPWRVPFIKALNTPYSSNPLIGAPTVGFVEHKTNGALVAMIFAMAEPNPGSSELSQNDYVMGVPLFISGERLSRRDPQSKWTFLTAYSQATPGWQEGMEPRGTLLILDPKTDVIVKNGLGQILTQGVDYTVEVNQTTDSAGAPVADPGKIVIKRVEDGEPLPGDHLVYITYLLNYADVTAANSINPRIYHTLPPQLPSTSGVRVQVSATPAMGPAGTMFVPTNESSTDGGAAVYALTYQGGDHGDKMSTDWVYRLANWDPGYDFETVKRWGIMAPDPSDPKNMVALRDLRFHSSAAVAKGKVYVTASGSNGGALLVFKEKSDFVIRVNQSNPQAAFRDTTTGHPRNIRIWQPDPLNMMANPVLEAASVPSSMIDRDNGTITIKDFSSNNLILRRGTVGNQTLVPITPGLPVVVLVNNVVLPQDQVDLSNWDNLLWYYPIVEHDGKPCTGIDSPPTVIGDTVYFVCNDGWMYSIDASPGLSGHSRLTDESKVQKRHLGGSGSSSGICQSISASNGLLAVITGEGLHALDNPITLIADANRAIEIDGSGEPIWACDALVFRDPIPGANISGMAMSSVRKESINRPSRIRSFGPSDYLVVNSGSDQVVRMTRSGDVTAMVKTFTDNYRRLLKSGEPLQLRGPTDATTWAENENGEYVYHWLIADAGNHRIVDLIHRFRDGVRMVANPAGGGDIEAAPDAPPELNWVSTSTDIGRNYRFNSAQIVNKGTEIWVAAGNWTVGERSYGTPGGSIVMFNYREPAGSGWTYRPGTVRNQMDTVNTISGVPVKLSNPRYLRIFDVYSGGSWTWRAIICDSRGVFDVDPAGVVQWSLTNRDVAGDLLGGTKYQDLLRTIDGVKQPFDLPVVKLDAVHVQRLPNNDLLITNSHSESDAAGNKFSGEVFQVTRPLTGSAEIVWYAPQVIINKPDPLDDTTWRLKQKMIGTYNLSQPMSAERVN